MEPHPRTVEQSRQNDQELLDQYRAGHREALEVIYDRYGQGLYSYALVLSKDASDAWDLVQETFLRLIRLEHPRPLESLGGYLYSVLRNLARDRFRKVLLHLKHRGSMTPAVGVTAGLAGVNEDILKAVSNLPVEQREILILKIFGGFTFAQAAEMMGTSLATAASRYQYAINRLSRLLLDYEDGYGF